MRKSAPRTPPGSDCPLEECLSVLSSRWTAKILWFLREGPRRFGDLRRDLGPVSSKVLTQRLRELELGGVISRTVRPTSPPTVEYEVTPAGRSFFPVLDAMEAAARKLRNKGIGCKKTASR